jgi:hypothetical protein
MSQPNYNSEGQQVWNPSVGAYFSPAKENAESFGGIVGALQDQLASQSAVVKGYPYSFAGIVSAIKDLTFAVQSPPGAIIGEKPSMGDVVIDANGDPVFEYSTAPTDGTLWFDTRQGRLFIAYQSDWYQTNGADGLPIITDSSTAPSASNLALGQFWFDTNADILYIFDGQYKEADNSIVTTPTATTTPIWIQLVDASAVANTATLLLAGPTLPARVTTAVTNSSYLPVVSASTITHQDDANLYLFDSLIALDTELASRVIPTTTSAPSNPVAGQLWYDTEDLELSIWYVEPGDSAADGQWVPTFSAIMQDQAIASVQTAIALETVNRSAADSTLTTSLETLTGTVSSNKSSQQNSIDALQAQINAIPSTDLTGYATTVEVAALVNPAQASVAGLLGDVASIYTNYTTKLSLQDEIAILNSSINARATSTELAAVQASIPSVAGYATETYVTSAIAALPAGITSAGGTVTGKLTLDKNDIAVPSLDFSTHSYDGKLAQKYRTNTSTEKYATFGTNDNLFEYNWDFTDCEDFCYTHSTNGKVASIDKTGIAAKALYIADFAANTTYGRALTNTIDVGARLTTYQTALTTLRTGAASATTLAELKTAIATALANV